MTNQGTTGTTPVNVPKKGIVALISALAIILTGMITVPALGSPGQTVTSQEASGLTAAQLAAQLIGDTTPFSNAKVTADKRAIGTVEGFSSIGIPKGIVLSTGLVNETAGTLANNLATGSAIPGPNNYIKTGFAFSQPGDADLDAVLAKATTTPKPTKDAAVLEFDFVPKSDKLEFKYVFASEEYPEFVGSPFNDVFGLFVNGENCAVVGAGKAPISVNTVNDKTNSSFYRDNPDVTSGPSKYDTGFDGMTTVLTCSVTVNKGVTNHVKFAIADTNDMIYDSGVFIQAGSFLTDFGDLTGHIYNDANSDGAISGSEPGLAGQTVALYDSSYKLIATTLTDATGAYKFSVSEGETYYVRPVQIKAPLADGTLMNAVQTYGAGSSTNPVTVKCVNGDITTDAGAKCDGAKSPASAEAPAGAIGTTSSPAEWLNYAKVEMNTPAGTTASFGFSSLGSYGDAVAGPAAITAAPAHINGANPVVWLGDKLGAYPGPATDGTAHNATDDGVYIDSYAGKLPLGGTILAAAKSYNLAGDVSGPSAASASVTAWTTGAGNDTWAATPTWSPTVGAGKAQGPFQFTTAPVTGTPTVQMRAQVSTTPINTPANGTGAYYSASNWATPGEIEDYSFKVADAVYRPAAVTTGGSGTFTVAGASIDASTTLKVGPAKAATAGAVQNLTASQPTGWRVESVTIKDTETGAVVATPAFTVSGGNAAFSYTPAAASDVIIEVKYGFAMDPQKSTFTVTPEAISGKPETQVVADGKSAYTGTLTARDSAGNPISTLDPSQVEFTASSPHVVISSVTPGAAPGTYTVTFTSTWAEDPVTAQVAYAGVPVVDAAGATVTRPIPFKAGPPVPKPNCTDPSRPGTNLSANPTNLGVGETSNVTALITDEFCNPVPGVPVNFSLTPGTDGVLTVTAGTTGPDGKAYAKVTDPTAETVQVNASIVVNGRPVPQAIDGSPVAITFGAGGFSGPNSSFTVTPVAVPGDPTTYVVADGEAAYTGTLTARDSKNNPLSGLTLADIKFTPSSPEVTVSSVTAGAAPGTYVVTFTSTRADAAPTAQVSYQGTFVTDAAGAKVTRPIPFKAGPPVPKPNCTDPARPGSNLKADPTSLTIGGTSNLTALVTDKFCNPVPDVPVDFTLEPGTDGVLNVIAGTTDPDGKAYATLTDSTAETVKAHAKIPYEGSPTDIAGSPAAVTFNAGTVDPGKSHVTVAPSTQTAGSPVTVTVTVRDAGNNPLDGLKAADFVMTGKSAGLPDLVFTKFTPGANGTYTFETTSPLVGTFTVRATVKGVLLNDAPTATFIAGEVCVSNCTPVDPTHITRIEMTVNDQLANGTAQDKAKGYAYDTYGNAVAGAVFTVTDASTGTLANFLTPKTQNSAPTAADGTTSVSWTSTKAGSFTATTTVKSGGMASGVEVANSDLNAIRFTNGLASAARSELTVTPATAQQVDASFTLQAKIVDSTGNPVRGETVTFSTSSVKAVLSELTCETISDGTCSVTVTSKFAGTYDVHATISVGGKATDLGGNGNPAKASPQKVTFYAGPLCVVDCTPLDDPDTPDVDESATNKSHMVVDPDYAVADGTDKDTVVVYAYDKFGNPKDNLPVNVVGATPDIKFATNLVTTNPLGIAKADATSVKAGAYPVIVASNGTTIPGSTITSAHFVAGSLGALTLTIDPTTAQEAGSTFTVTAKATDVAGNPIHQAAVSFALPTGLTTTDGKTEKTCTTLASTGQCTIQVTSTKTGTYPITATTGTLTSNTVNAQFTPGPVDPGQSTAVVTHDGEGVGTGGKDIVTVTAKDRFGNPVPGASVSSTPVAGKAPGLTIQPDVAKTDANGETTIWYTSSEAGAKVADVRINTTVTPTGSPVTLHFGNGDGNPDHSSWTITPKTPLTVGTTAASAFTLTATVKDVFDAPVAGAVVSFNVDKDTTAWGSATQTCTTGSTGVCSVTVTSTKAGTFAFTAALAAGQIGMAQPAVWTPDVVCGPCSSAELITDKSTADGNARNIVKVTARDKYDNPVPGQVVASTSSDATLLIQKGIPFTKDDGTTTIWYSSTKAGQHTADITIGTAAVTPNGSPVTMTFVAGAADPEKSTLTVSPTDPTAGDTATATITARDAFGNPVPDVIVSVGSTGNSTRDKDTCKTGANGVCTVGVTDKTAETIQVTATIPVNGADKPVSGSPATVTFHPGPPAPHPVCEDPSLKGTNLSVNPATVEVPGTTTATAYITDAYCNPVGAGVTVNFGANGSAVVSSPTAKTGADSKAVVTVRDTKPEDVDVTAALGTTQIDGSPARVHFVDTNAPAAPYIRTPADGTVTKDRPLPVTGDGEPGAHVVVKDGTGKTVCEADVTAAGTWTCQANLPDGTHQLTARQTDPSGNTSGPSNTVKVTIDTTKPNTPVVDDANAHEITGHVPGEGAGTDITVTDPDGNVICTTKTDDKGNWTCPEWNDPRILDEDTDITVVATDPAGNVSDPGHGRINLIPPAPIVDPTNGSEVKGYTVPGTTATVLDPDGKPVPGCTDVVPDINGNFICTPVTRLTPGTTIKVVAKDDAGNVSKPTPVVVTGIAVEVMYPTRHVLEAQTVTGTNFNRGETVCLVLHSDPVDLGCEKADDHGKVVFTFLVPKNTNVGEHTVTLTGEKSGQVSTTFKIIASPTVSTGGTASSPTPLPYGLLFATMLIAGGVMTAGTRWLRQKA